MDIRRRFLSKKSSGGSSGGDSSGTYTVNLNSQWEKTTAVTNPDSSLYDGVYRSSSSYNVNNGVSIMYITLTGYSTFKLYIRSYAESNYDYVMVSQLDKTITGSSSYSDTTLVKAHTRGNQQSGTELSSYTLVEYTGISSGSHTITIVYRKDGSVNNGDDRGYVLIPKSQESGGGDVDIDTTFAIYYTTTDNSMINVSSSSFGAPIKSHVYINNQGIISFESAPTEILDLSNSSLKTIIADNVLTIGSGNKAVFPDTLTYGMFKDVNEVKVFAFPKSNYADIHFGQNITTIDNGSRLSKCSIHISNMAQFSQGSVDFSTEIVQGGVTLYVNDKKCLEIVVPSGVTTVGNVFSHVGANKITLPRTTTSIATYAFQSSTIKEIRCEASNPPTLGSFSLPPTLESIKVPASSVELYKNATNWRSKASLISSY